MFFFFCFFLAGSYEEEELTEREERRERESSSPISHYNPCTTTIFIIYSTRHLVPIVAVYIFIHHYEVFPIRTVCCFLCWYLSHDETFFVYSVSYEIFCCRLSKGLRVTEQLVCLVFKVCERNVWGSRTTMYIERSSISTSRHICQMANAARCCSQD